MKRKLGIDERMGPLTVGNVVTAAMRLYNSNLKKYLQIALIAHLWILPAVLASTLIVGFVATSLRQPALIFLAVILAIVVFAYFIAKYLANSAVISRLAFGELIGQPETVAEARSKLEPLAWSFLGIAWGVGIRLFGIYIGMYFAIATMVIVVILTLGQIAGAIVAGLLALVLIIGGLIWIIRLYSRWAIAEVPLAVEGNLKAVQSIKRSWDLTQTAVGRIQGIVMVAFLVTLPVQIFSSLPQFFLRAIRPTSPSYWWALLVNLGLSLAGGLLVMPFWQIIKALIYYDLRVRREGLDLQLRQDNLTDEDSF